MKLLCLLLCIACANCFYIDTDLSRKEMIVGGTVSWGIAHNYAALYYLGKLFCGASIISHDFLLSGEICFINMYSFTNIKLRYGYMHDSNTPSDSFKDIGNVIKYSDDFPKSDVYTNPALIWVPEDIIFDRYARPVPMHQRGTDPPVDALMIIAGFGKEMHTDRRTSSWLREAEVKVLPRAACTVQPDRLFCAESSPHDPCFGDEGGPGLIGDKLFAIITNIPNCGQERAPTNYTKVGPFYKWMSSKVGYAL